MPKPDELIVNIAALVESGRSSRMSLTVVAGGAVITGRLAPEAVWRQRVSEVLTDSAQLNEFSAVFGAPEEKDGPPTHLHFHVARILQGTVGHSGDGRDVPHRDRGCQCLDRGRLQLLRPLTRPPHRERHGMRGPAGTSWRGPALLFGSIPAPSP
ncbi:hypothetical protein GCM10023238_30270 [Streptomyces heliomycini]